VRGEVRGIGLVSSPANRALDGKGVEVMGGEAPFELRAELDHGVLRAGTHFRTEPFAAHAKASGLVFDGSVQVDAHVDDGGVAFADLRVEDVRAAARGKTQATVASFAVTLTTRDLDLAKEPFSNSLYAVEVNRAESDAMAFWSSYVPFPAGVDVDSAHAVLGARIHGVTRDMKAEGYVTVALERLAIAGRGGSVVGDLEGVVQLDGSLPAERVDLTRSRLSLRHLIARMQGSHLEIPRLDARAEDLVVGRGRATGRVAIEAPQVLLPVLTTVGSFLPLPEDVSIEGGGCTARVRLDVDVARLVATGEVAILARNLHVRVADRHLAGDLTMTLRAKEHGTETDVSGTEVAFRSAAGPKTVDWWVRARMRQATLQVRPGFRFRSGVVASARDGSPLTALVADNTAIPHWLIDVVSTRSLEVTGDVLVTPSVFALRSVEAHAAGAYVGFELGKIRRDRKEWAMLLDLGAALAGVDVTDGHTQVLLLGARPWFQAKVALLQAAERRSE